MKNKLTWGIILLSLGSVFTSCQTSKQLTYFQDISDTTSLQQIQTAKPSPIILQPEDQVQVSISSPSAEASSFFNLVEVSPSASVASGQQNFINLYTVSNEGFITMPVLGDIKAGGLIMEQLKQRIIELLKPYLTHPIVSTRLVNFKVTVLGEVIRPQTISVIGEKINVLEAIGASGDMTMYGARKKVKVIRRLPDGNTEIARLDFNNSKIFQSPYFNLRQNDIIYIQPNRNKSFLANNTTFWASIAISVASIIAVIITRN